MRELLTHETSLLGGDGPSITALHIGLKARCSGIAVRRRVSRGTYLQNVRKRVLYLQKERARSAKLLDFSMDPPKEDKKRSYRAGYVFYILRPC